MAETTTFSNGIVFLEYDRVNSDELILRCVKTVLKKEASTAKVVRTANGKPMIEGADIYVSLSHTKGLTVVALSKKPVGIDVERLDREVDYRGLSRRYCKECETRQEFLMWWTAAEANAKREGNAVSDWFGKVPQAEHQQLNGYLIAVSV